MLHVAQTHDGRLRAVLWIFSALNTVEPPIVQHESATVFARDKPCRAEHLAVLEERVRSRLYDLAHRLADAARLDGPFSPADLMMVLVLRRLEAPASSKSIRPLSADVKRATVRPACQRARRDQAEV